ncbi:pyridoxal phosphate-dependent transferase [Pilobolus umbonatus]|nr:pyridoxal phosphate-dependent transferase [Pilobolus umbonatus]
MSIKSPTLLEQGIESIPQKLKECYSRAHQTLRSYPGNINRASSLEEQGNIHGIDHPGSTGVIYVMDRAAKHGYESGSDDWANFGRGSPEVDDIEGCMKRPKEIKITKNAYEYGPTAGVKQLREAVANLYNELYRGDKVSKYSYKNVCIVPGGRAGLTRIGAVIGDINVGYFLPEYTAYEQMLSIFKKFVPIPTTLEEDSRYHIDAATVKKEITSRGLGVIVASNPRNPTGQVIQDEELKTLFQVGKETHTTLVMDEFYSAYIYDQEKGKTVSISEFVEDVNRDPVILLDGLTKNFRMPGWRICWIVGPESVISSLESAGSFLDGGANHALQMAAIPFVDPDVYRNEAKCLQEHFQKKRDYVLKELKKMGLYVKVPPNATFYIWLDLSKLPEPINVGLNFFEECLLHKVIVVPGIFFDVNPSHRRDLFQSPCHQFVRLSFGPPMEELKLGLKHMQKVLDKYKVKSS